MHVTDERDMFADSEGDRLLLQAGSLFAVPGNQKATRHALAHQPERTKETMQIFFRSQSRDGADDRARTGPIDQGDPRRSEAAAVYAVWNIADAPRRELPYVECNALQ